MTIHAILANSHKFENFFQLCILIVTKGTKHQPQP